MCDATTRSKHFHSSQRKLLDKLGKFGNLGIRHTNYSAGVKDAGFSSCLKKVQKKLRHELLICVTELCLLN